MGDQPTAELPLAGIEVIEMSTMVTCSLAAMMLRAQGAKVIKIEPAQTGDPMRMIGTQKNGISALFHNCNRGKRSLAIDIKDKAGRAAVHALVKRADIVLNNYRPGVMDKLGFSWDDLRQLNPRLIDVSVTGFGTVGPMAHRPAYDQVIQGITATTDLQGSGEAFEFMRMLICDKVTAYTAAQAATSALVARARTGAGQHIDVSMLHACLAFMWPDGMMNHTIDDAVVLPAMSDYYQTLTARDGAVAAAPLSDAHWDVLLKMVGRDDLRDDPRFNSMAGRGKHVLEVLEILKNSALHLSVDEIMTALEAGDIPSTICERRASLAQNEQIQAIGALETYVTENLGRVTGVAPPIRFNGAATSLAEASPTLGAHSFEILSEIGLSPDAIQQLVDQEIVKCA